MAPVMLLSDSSVKDLSSKLEKGVTVERFRPNIVVSDCEAFEEVGSLVLNNNETRFFDLFCGKMRIISHAIKE